MPFTTTISLESVLNGDAVHSNLYSLESMSTKMLFTAANLLKEHVNENAVHSDIFS